MRGNYETVRSRRRRKRNAMRMKYMALLLAFMLVLVGAAGGSLAWLTAKVEPIRNAFTIGNIGLEAKSGAAVVSNEDITYVPGQTVENDVKFTMQKGSEASYLFIHVQEKNNANGSLSGKIVQYSVNSNLNAVPDHDGYYYMVVETSVSDQEISVFVDGKFKISSELTKEIIDSDGYQSPEIIVSAAAVQKENIPDKTGDETIDYLDAWELLPAEFTGNSTNP